MKYANHHGYSDVDPFEVVRVVSDKTIEIREMTADQNPAVKPTFTVGGFSAHSDNVQDWFITSNPANPVIKIRLQKNGQWRDAHKRRFVLADAPRKFYDYNF